MPNYSADIIAKAKVDPGFKGDLQDKSKVNATVETFVKTKDPLFVLPSYVKIHVEVDEDADYYLILPPQPGPRPPYAAWRDVLPSNGHAQGIGLEVVTEAHNDPVFRGKLLKSSDDAKPAVEGFFDSKGKERKPPKKGKLRFKTIPKKATLEVVQETWDDLWLFLDRPPEPLVLDEAAARPGGETCMASSDISGCCQ
jgi:hypothetical protein